MKIPEARFEPLWTKSLLNSEPEPPCADMADLPRICGFARTCMKPIRRGFERQPPQTRGTRPWIVATCDGEPPSITSRWQRRITQNFVYDLDALIPDLDCDEPGCVKRLQIERYATSATSSPDAFRIGDYDDGAAWTGYGATGECCECVPVPASLALPLMGRLVLVDLRRRSNEDEYDHPD